MVNYFLLLFVLVNLSENNIEDIVPFPHDTHSNRPTARKYHRSTSAQQNSSNVTANQTVPESNCSSPRSGSSRSSTSDEFPDFVQDYKCQGGTCSYQQRRQCAGLIRCYQATSNVVQVKMYRYDTHSCVNVLNVHS